MATGRSGGGIPVPFHKRDVPPGHPEEEIQGAENDFRPLCLALRPTRRCSLEENSDRHSPSTYQDAHQILDHSDPLPYLRHRVRIPLSTIHNDAHRVHPEISLLRRQLWARFPRYLCWKFVCGAHISCHLSSPEKDKSSQSFFRINGRRQALWKHFFQPLHCTWTSLVWMERATYRPLDCADIRNDFYWLRKHPLLFTPGRISSGSL